MRPSSLAAIVVVVCACRREQPLPASADPITSASTSKVPTALLAWLGQAQVDDGSFAKSTFYTWTTGEQIDELATSKVLLQRTSSSIGSAAYDIHLQLSQDPFARRLRDDEFARVRFAWTAGWPTVLGLAEHRYGAHLVEVRLKPTAVVARFELGEPIRFHDLQQHEIPAADVVAHPERLAAVLHVDTSAQNPAARYREYVLLNESMVEEWSYGTPQLLELVASDRRNVAALRARLGDASKLDLATIWRAGAPPDDLTARYLGALAFDNRAYRPQTLTWDELVAALGPAPDARPALRVVPTATWPPPPLPKPKPTAASKATVW
jgi:hypothetical protein